MNKACLISLAGVALLATTASAQWVTFQNQTGSRLVAPPSLVVNDNIEKDFGWGDFDKDGDIDLAVVRKFPGSIQGGFRNLLLMNEGGVLVDRTDEYATDSDVPGDGGFLAKTNDRDVKVGDFNNDGWLDLVTATTMSDQVNDILGQPRIYINKGNDAQGNWLGFRFENDRIPVLFAKNGTAANPRACDLAIGDLTGDGYLDIFFVDYDTPETSGTVCIDLNGDGDTNDPDECQQSPAENPTKDYDNKFLINLGAANPGFFQDTTNTRFTSSQLASAFGNAVEIADINGDGFNDVVRINTLTGGQNVAALYGASVDGTTFTGPSQITGGAPYNQAVGDLNNDGRLDIVVIDDSKDKFLINNGNNAQGLATWTSFTINDSLTEFGNQPVLADLDNDGFVDLMVADVDADLPSFCPTTGRRAHIYRNTFGENPTPSGNTLDEIGQVIPNNMLAATYDFAPIDINQDGWLDLVIGRCAGIEIWMNVPPIALSFSYPDGLPGYLTPGAETSFNVQTSIIGGGQIVPGSMQIFTSVDGGAFTGSAMTDLGGGLFGASLPAVECGSSVAYYVSGDITNGPIFTDPPTAPASVYASTAIDRVEVVLDDDLEGQVAGWTVANTGPITAGTWEQATPNGTVVSGAQAAPAAAFSGTKAFVTGNGLPGGSAGSADLDGGPTVLTSPVFDLSGSDAIISYARWFFCDDAGAFGADSLVVEITNDGSTWAPVETVSTNAGEWVVHSFLASDVIARSATMQLRWTVNDTPNNSVTEAGVDAFLVETLVCDETPACPADLDGSGSVDGGDLGVLLSQFGGPGSADLDASGTVDGGDLGVLLAAWGACQN